MMREPIAIGPVLRLGFLLLAVALAGAAFFLVPPAGGPPAIALGTGSAVAGAILGTAVATLLRRIEPAAPNLQRRRSIAMLASGVLAVTSGVFLVNAARLTDIGTGMELPIIAVADDGTVTSPNLDAGNGAPTIVKPTVGPPPRVGGCVWLADKRGMFGAGLFQVAETRACSPIRGRFREGQAPAIALPANGAKADWRWMP